MPSEAVLRMRIEQAAKDAERATRNRDETAYWAAVARYKAADKWLAQLEATRNNKAIAELEARADKNGFLSYAKIMAVGVPVQLMEARGWVNLHGRAGMRKEDSVNPSSGGEKPREVDRDDNASDADGEHASEQPGDESA